MDTLSTANVALRHFAIALPRLNVQRPNKLPPARCSAIPRPTGGHSDRSHNRPRLASVRLTSPAGMRTPVALPELASGRHCDERTPKAKKLNREGKCHDKHK